MKKQYSIVWARVGLLSSVSLFAAAAQAQNGQSAAQQQQLVAEGCLAELQQLRERISEDGVWAAGWGTSPYGVPGTAAAEPPIAPAQPIAPAVPETEPSTAGAVESPGSAQVAAAPRYQIRALIAAAHVLAQRGNEEACRAVTAELNNAYDEYVERLRAAGLEGEEFRSLRQEQIVAAVPVAEADLRGFSIDHVTGSDLRNMQDESLGSIKDVILDPETGQITHAVVARGGFFGIGEDQFAVPWRLLKVTPDLNTFVLDVPEQVVENAPDYDGSGIAQEAQDQIDRFWDEASGG